jgi:hypothetical protein
VAYRELHAVFIAYAVSSWWRVIQINVINTSKVRQIVVKSIYEDKNEHNSPNPAGGNNQNAIRIPAQFAQRSGCQRVCLPQSR